MKKSKSTRHKMGEQPMPKGGKSHGPVGDDLTRSSKPRKKFAGVSQVAKRRNYPVE